MRLLLALIFKIIALLIPAGASAAEMPMRKAGLWEFTYKNPTTGASRATSSGEPIHFFHCTDEAVETDMMVMTGNGATPNMCPHHTVKKCGQLVTVESSCQLGNVEMTSRATYVGDFNSIYTARTSSKAIGKEVPGLPSPPFKETPTTETLVEVKWTGACKESQQPGDVIMPNGQKYNIRQAIRMRDEAREAQRNLDAFRPK